MDTFDSSHQIDAIHQISSDRDSITNGVAALRASINAPSGEFNTPILAHTGTFPENPTELAVMAVEQGIIPPWNNYARGALLANVVPYNGHEVQRGQRLETTVGPVLTLPEYVTTYPESVVKALELLYTEYNAAFVASIERNREFDTDYQYMFDDEGNFANIAVQIDMTGLPADFLYTADNYSPDEMKEILRDHIFEFENSLAMYQLLMKMFAREGSISSFENGFRETLDDLRLRTGKKVAIVAVTEEKYQSLRTSEFGRLPDEALTDDHVQKLSGFDRLFGPDDLVRYMEENAGDSEYLFYVRASEPLSNLRSGEVGKTLTIIDDPRIRQYVKAYSITPNIDKPGNSRRINDTKDYMIPMDMAMEISNTGDLNNIFSPKLVREIVLRQMKNILGSPKMYTNTLKQRIYDDTGRAFKIVFRDNNGSNVTPEGRLEMSKNMFEDTDRQLMYDLLLDSTFEDIFSPEGLKTLKTQGVDLSEGIVKAFGIESLLAKGKTQSRVNLIQTVLNETPLNNLMSNDLEGFLTRKAVDPLEVATGNRRLRLKPLQASYGAYGHMLYDVSSAEGLRKLMAQINQRGPYVLQPEIDNPNAIINGVSFVYIDRNFLSMVGGKCRFLGGFRSLMPLNTLEAENGRVHGNKSTHWAPIESV